MGVNAGYTPKQIPHGCQQSGSPRGSCYLCYDTLATGYNQLLLPDFALLIVIHKLMLSDCIFTPSDSDEEYADSWFNWD